MTTGHLIVPRNILQLALKGGSSRGSLEGKKTRWIICVNRSKSMRVLSFRFNRRDRTKTEGLSFVKREGAKKKVGTLWPRYKYALPKGEWFFVSSVLRETRFHCVKRVKDDRLTSITQRGNDFSVFRFPPVHIIRIAVKTYLRDSPLRTDSCRSGVCLCQSWRASGLPSSHCPGPVTKNHNKPLELSFSQ